MPQITLQTTVGEILRILNAAVKPLEGKKFEGGYGSFHKMVHTALEDIEFPEGFTLGAGGISHEHESVFQYTKDITEDKRYENSFGKQKGKINSLCFWPADDYYDPRANDRRNAAIPYPDCNDEWTLQQWVDVQALFRAQILKGHIEEYIDTIHENLKQQYKYLGETVAEVEILKAKIAKHEKATQDTEG